MKVHIIKKQTDKVVGSYEVNVSNFGVATNEQEYFDEAWRCAIEDGLVEEADRSKYSFVSE